jgi:hypothetical protein
MFRKTCDGRESNQDQLLGRQLCSQLYHHRIDTSSHKTQYIIPFILYVKSYLRNICKLALTKHLVPVVILSPLCLFVFLMDLKGSA